MEFIQDFAPMAVVVVICVPFGMFLKWNFEGNAGNTAAIPWMLALTGGTLGIVAQLVMPEYKELDRLTAFAMGIVSGLASVGAYQVVHQYKKLEK